jgi:hypothetical protein
VAVFGSGEVYREPKPSRKAALSRDRAWSDWARNDRAAGAQQEGRLRRN